MSNQSFRASRVLSAILSVVPILAIFGTITLPEIVAQENGDGATEASPVQDESTHPIKISRETTFFTEPIGDDGKIDLLAALNAHLQEGVTDENNAARHMFLVLGPESLREVPAETFELMRIDWDDAGDEFFETVDDYAMRKGLAVDEGSEYSQSMSGPWSRAELPLMDAWLTEQSDAMDRLVEAIEMEGYYVPLVPAEEGGLMSIRLEHVHISRSIARSLTVRAYAHLHNGNMRGAIDDFHAIHVLARHLSHNATLVEKLVGIAIDGIAYAGDRKIYESRQHMSHVYRYFEEQMSNLGEIEPMYESLNLGERVMAIDVVMQIAESNELSEETMSLIGMPAIVSRILGTVSFDWNEVLRILNHHYDEYVAIAKLPDAERVVKAAEFMEEVEKNAKAAATPGGVLRILASIGKDDHQGEEALVSVLFGLLVPALNATEQAEWRSRTYVEVFDTAFALERYRNANGRFPESLDALVPDFLAEVPIDRFSGAPLVFEADADSFALYSVGQNRVDNGGLGYEEGIGNDDLGIRLGR